MRRLRNLPLERRVVALTVVSCVAALLVAGVALGVYEFRDERRNMADLATVLADVIAENSKAALAFEDDVAARAALASFVAETHVAAAAVYTAHDRLLARYVRDGSTAAIAESPPADGHRFEGGHLLLSRPVHLGQRRIGTVHVVTDLGGFYERLGRLAVVGPLSALLALLVATVLSTRLQRLVSAPILELAETAHRIAERKDFSLRAQRHGDDEVGRLTDAFNQMLSRIEEHEGALENANNALRDEIGERVTADRKVAAQLASLELLSRITRATAERRDLESICDVTVVSLLEDLPADLALVATHDPAGQLLTVIAIGVRDVDGAAALNLAPGSSIPLDDLALAHGVDGPLGYEPDTTALDTAFPRRLAGAGLRSLVVAPLRFESDVFGALIVARGDVRAFSSDECQFLRQLSEHVALSVHQAQLYGALQQAYEDLGQTQQAVMQQERLHSLGEMASGIAHDINNALAPIMIYNELLVEQETDLSPRARDYLAASRRSVSDVTETIARMREFYRQREPQLTLFDIDVHTLLREVVELTRARWSTMPQERGVVVRLDVDFSAEQIKVRGVESELRQAFTNLVFNAVDAMPGGGTITLRTRVVDGPTGAPRVLAQRRVVIEVRDTGVGMSEATRQRCLEPFFTTKGDRGTGLGLAMVYGTIQRHNAELEIDSALGAGATFRLIFPEAIGAVQGVEGHQEAPRPIGRLRLLVVDDDPLVLRAVCRALETDGHVVSSIKGGREAIETFRESLGNGQPFAAVITDLGMPHVDGRRLAAQIKMMSAGTPVILLTGWGQRLMEESGTPSHVDRVLSKPPKLAELRAALAETCGGAQANH